MKKRIEIEGSLGLVLSFLTDKERDKIYKGTEDLILVVKKIKDNLYDNKMSDSKKAESLKSWLNQGRTSITLFKLYFSYGVNKTYGPYATQLLKSELKETVILMSQKALLLHKNASEAMDSVLIEIAEFMGAIAVLAVRVEEEHMINLFGREKGIKYYKEKGIAFSQKI